MKKINLKGISEILSEKELKNVVGGGSACPGAYGCSSAGQWVGGGLCCPLPCNGIFHEYGLAIVFGVNGCPW